MLAALYAFVLGLALVVSVLHAYFRDVAPILSAALLPWFFLSPIFFQPDSITEHETAKFALEWVNPVAPFIEGVRSWSTAARRRRSSVLAYVVVAGAVAFFAGRALFARLQAELAVVV